MADESHVSVMFARILVAIDDFGESQAELDLVKGLATEGTTRVHAVHCRLRELSGYSWYARESRGDASFQAEAAVFDLRMAGLAAGAEVRYAIVDRVAEAILAEAVNFDADLIVLGPPRRRELAARLFGSVTQRVVQRAKCPVIIAPRAPGRPQPSIASDSAATGRS
jgi:nucleotide-binding universal stress UspA family protein